MRVNLEWLRDWVDVGDDGRLLAEELTTVGLEVDSVEPAAPSCEGVVVARVERVELHPDAERLSVCIVDAGEGTHRVVCGAPNVAAGLIVPYAPIGTRLPNGQTIEAAELRGVVSEGMLCSARELGLSDDGTGLLVLDGEAAPGTPLLRHLALDDEVLDVDITPNRGDCFSVLGIAREIAAKRGVPLAGPALEPVPASHDERFAVQLENAVACPRFASRVVRNLDMSRPTPDWLVERLRRAGARAIHPVVDITNYVMLELGQPLHAYDLSKLSSQIVVRSAKARETLTLLDGKQVELDPDTLVIADGSGAIGMAGIMGGQTTAVDDGTRDVLLESAFFSPDAILGRARQYGLHTDASLRFERGVDPARQERAIERATELLLEISGGEPGPLEVVESSEQLPRRAPVALRPAQACRLLGVEIEPDTMERLLTRLGMRVERAGTTGNADAWSITPPSFRFDIAIEEDLIEELGRLLGYDNIPIVPGAGPASLGSATETRIDEERLADLLVARGYTEVITYGFTDPRLAEALNPGAEPVTLANPISSDLAVMRRSLWPGLLAAAQQNLSRQQSRLRIFELGHQFEKTGEQIRQIKVLSGLAAGTAWPEHWAHETRDADYFDVKGDLEALLTTTGRISEITFEAEAHPALRPGQSARIRRAGRHLGWLGCIHPKVQRLFDLKAVPVVFALDLEAAFEARVPSFEAHSKFPAVRRDLAVVVDEALPVARLVECIRASAAATLQSVTVFDVYQGKGVESKRKSVGLGLILQDVSRTLTDKDADEAVQSVIQRLEQQLGATIRT